MTEKRKVIVNIDDQEYTVIGDESEEYIHNIASYVDEKIKEITSKNRRLNRSMAAILAAFTIADQYYKTYTELEELKEYVKEPLKELEEIKSEYKENKDKLNELKEERDKFKKDLKDINKDKESKNKKIIQYEEALKLKEEELNNTQKIINQLQNKLFENQIELVQTKKELNEIKKDYNK
ncbi:MAG: cell division protein ZapA [Firmicutes bacterium]|nr:cell division protein ZapA [Bacillota bacterium]MTI69783.1 cell division protein ZapA [Bacillota bacterium]